MFEGSPAVIAMKLRANTPTVRSSELSSNRVTSMTSTRVCSIPRVPSADVFHAALHFLAFPGDPVRVDTSTEQRQYGEGDRSDQQDATHKSWAFPSWRAVSARESYHTAAP